MTTQYSTAAQNAACDAVVDLVDLGTGTTTGAIKIYSGAPPGPNAAATGTLLATIPFPANPAFGASSAGSATSGDPASVNAAATGTAGYFRVVDRDGVAKWDGLCGVSVAVTATAATDLFTTSAAHGLGVGNVIHLASGITGVAAGDYTVIETASSTTFKIAAYASSTSVNVTADSSGSYSLGELVLSSLSLVSGNPVDISAWVHTQPA